MPSRSPSLSSSSAGLLKSLKAAADPTRLRILRMLAVKPLCVCEVMSVLGMAQSTTSRHLRILHDAEFVEEVPGGIWTVYQLRASQRGSPISTLLGLIGDVEPAGQLRRDRSLALRVDRNRLCRRRVERAIQSGRR